ncbi:MAG: primosomal protein N' [Castellaniella sp.]|uniref:primosomal protein N' n=1 Tax=Castellaniella sp. TaxID=1955812 RepID=UPI002A35920B|nr:primosomal protein N' [Castellaniella sp.]MDY0309066.1 primosomal protein N' [Castellaniella sp.]
MAVKRPVDKACGVVGGVDTPAPAPAQAAAPPADSGATVYLAVALDVPLPGLFDYSHDRPVAPGVRVRVKFGRRAMVGMVWAVRDAPAVAADRVRPIDAVLDDLPPMPDDWLRLAEFAAHYYHRPLGEVLLPVLPPPLRKPAAYTGARSAGGPVCRADRRPQPARARKSQNIAQLNADRQAPDGAAVPQDTDPVADSDGPALTDAQVRALAGLEDLLAAGAGVALLHGVTGSGKTELYLRLARQVMAAGRQVLLLVPEINLTPQLEHSVRTRLGDSLAVIHSRLSEGDRLRAWLRASRGQADILLGTRLALFTPLPRLGLIVVDEEHDASYKQQDGLRYSARDLAVWRGHDLGIPVLLGSATPSLETWRHAQAGDYQLLSLPDRAQAQPLPEIRLVDTRRARLEQGFTPQLLDALAARLAQGGQSLVFINRRGYAPVLRCPSCAWVSDCRRCTAHMVLHRLGGRHILQCHHCGDSMPVPRACPDCGDPDIQPMGRGTQRVEEFLAERFPGARILRIDADATRLKGSAEALFAQAHAGQADILVGTQMVSKGHDFARLGLVGVLNADAMLFSQDFRAPERLFAQLMQVAGRAGRREGGAQVIVQTDYPEQAVYQALLRHDYARFAACALEERRDLGLPPFSNQALLTAQAVRVRDALDFLAAARARARTLPESAGVRIHDPVPLRIVRVARIERAQLLFESDGRGALHRLLRALLPGLDELARGAVQHWGIEIDPQEI